MHDITAEVYTQPFHAVSDAVAKRILANCVNSPGSSIYENPEDFRLYRIDYYDDIQGVVVQQEHQFIVRASEVKRFPPDDSTPF